MVSLVTACTDCIIRDFAALRTSAVHQWFALQTELLKNNATGGSGGSGAGDAPLSPSSSGRLSFGSGSGGGGASIVPSQPQSSIPTSSLPEMLQQNESMLSKLISREKTSTTRLQRLLEEEAAQKQHTEAKVADLQNRIETLDAHLQSLQNSKHSAEQRASIEVSYILMLLAWFTARYNNITLLLIMFFQVSTLQQRVTQLMADIDKRQDEYSSMVSSLTQSHEDQVARQASHLAAVMEQRIEEANVSHIFLHFEMSLCLKC